ncbi:MAG: hypothetical protein H6765_00220 [Candidatus Peribacteria bacterium]|nr:MAG: hypothetical protein H6765_00220 [Candidatus Peribacteria bacterium]
MANKDEKYAFLQKIDDSPKAEILIEGNGKSITVSVSKIIQLLIQMDKQAGDYDGD